MATLAVAAGIGVALIADADAAVAFSGCHTSGRYEVCVTSPEEYPDGVDLTIVNRLRDYVQATGARDTIHGAMYVWDAHYQGVQIPEIVGLADDLIKARADGADVHIIIDNSDRRNGRSEFIIQRLRAGGVPVTICDGGCLPYAYDSGPDGMHLKAFTFDSGGEVTVAHTSANLTLVQAKRHQNMITVTGDQALYDNYVGFWDRMSVGSWTFDGEAWTGRERSGDAPGLKSYFFPRDTGDPVPGTLNKLSCAEGNDRVWVAHSLFTSFRPGTLRVLDNLHSRGCDVRIILSRAEDRQWVLSQSNLDPDKVRLLDGAGEVWSSHHHKLIITDAIYEGDDNRPAVYGGSHNLNVNELRRSSDAMLRIVDRGAFDVFADYYEGIFELAHT